jgi:hypothetical protein
VLSGKKDDLAKLRHPVAIDFVWHKEHLKIYDDYLSKCRDLAEYDVNGELRLHPTINYFGATTGRMSVGDPPLQQFPELARGVITYSSGNHAQGVARAARLLGTAAVVVMPSDAPEVKRERVAADGAEIVIVGTASDERQRVAEELAARRGLAIIPPFVVMRQGLDVTNATWGMVLLVIAVALVTGKVPSRSWKSTHPAGRTEA